MVDQQGEEVADGEDGVKVGPATDRERGLVAGAADEQDLAGWCGLVALTIWVHDLGSADEGAVGETADDGWAGKAV